jgi:hypothetical protein
VRSIEAIIANKTDIGDLETMRDNARGKGDRNVELKCQQRIDILQMQEYQLDASNERHRELMHWTMEGLRIYEQRRAEEKGQSSYTANRTRSMMKRRGIIDALANLAARSDPSLGFDTLSDTEHVQWTAEAGVCKFNDLFQPDLIQKAEKRLAGRT